MKHPAALACWLCILGTSPLLCQTASAAAKIADPAAVAEVKAGTRTSANVAWWGFDADDATVPIQAAIDSGARQVVIPFVGRPWIVRPIRLRSRLELVLEPGVLLLAKKGEFRGTGDCLLKAADATDVTVRGYGATLRMHKKDYQSPPYLPTGWRMGVSFVGCTKVRVEGLRIESTGGDGIYISSTADHRWCEDVIVRDCVSTDNHRQGMSVISAHKLLVDNCRFERTSGTEPEAGIDFEPDVPDERISECVVRNCRFENNAGHAILVYLNPLTSKSHPVSITFENCLSRMGRPGMSPADFRDPDMQGWAGMAVGTVRDDGPQGLVEFRHCVAENTSREGAKIFDKAARSVTVRFVSCAWKNSWVARSRDYSGPRAPVLIQLRDDERTRHPGGVEFVDCRIHDDIAGPAIVYDDRLRHFPLNDVNGNVLVHGTTSPIAFVGRDTVNVKLRVRRAED